MATKNGKSSKPTVPSTRTYHSRMSAMDMLRLAEGKIFSIEKNPPPPMRADQVQMRAILEKVDRTLKILEKGQAFIMPKNTKGSIQRHLKENYESKFRYTTIADNPEAIRIYRLT